MNPILLLSGVVSKILLLLPVVLLLLHVVLVLRPGVLFALPQRLLQVLDYNVLLRAAMSATTTTRTLRGRSPLSSDISRVDHPSEHGVPSKFKICKNLIE